jgi:aquaporin Z
MDRNDLKKYAAELVGTFALVLVGCGSAVLAGKVIGVLGIALAFGLTVLAMVYAIGPISGCHINPAISVAMLVAGKQRFRDTLLYVIMQCLGAVAAAAVLWFLACSQTRGGLGGVNAFLAGEGLGQNGYGPGSPGGYALGACFLAEFVFTALFLLVIFGATSAKAPAGFAGLAIGIALTIIHLVSIPLTGTSVNPARSLGPALVAGGLALSQVWLFLVAPTLGGIFSAVLWRGFFGKD